MKTTRAFEPKSGRPTSIRTAHGMSTFQDHAYAWLTTAPFRAAPPGRRGAGRRRGRCGREFAYDHLGRLDRAATKRGGSMSAGRTLDYAYDPNGNLTSKTSDVSGDRDVASTMYGQRSAGPHALTRARVGGMVHRFHYDAQGHLEWDDALNGDDRFVEWDGRGLAVEVTVGTAKDAAKPTARETFKYGPGGARYLKTSEWRVGTGDSAVLKSETTYYVGAYEKRTRACTLGEGDSATESTQSVERTRVGPVLHVRKFACGSATASTPEIEYRHFDHLGSSASITDAAGSELVSLAHDPHGERRRPDWTRRLSDAEIGALASDHPDRTSRGFTGHEHLDRTGLVHMNGRLYDPLLGRFLSPDPIVADPGDGQQWNLYSYAGNSPLSYVDPSGLSLCNPAQQSWCGGVGLPGSGWLGGGSGARTVTGASVHVTFGVYYDVSWRWQSRWQAEWDVDRWAWTDHGFWDEIVSASVYPSYEVRSWSVQVVEKGTANEPASSHSPRSGASPGKNGPLLPRQQAARRAIGALIKGGVLDPNKVFTGQDALDRAAIEVLDAVHPISEKYNVEIGGPLVSAGEGVSYGAPFVGTEDMVPVWGGGAGGYHTHPGGSDFFSNEHLDGSGRPGDVGWVQEHGIPLYMSSRPGGPNTPIVVRACIPGSSRCNPNFVPPGMYREGTSKDVIYRGVRGRLVR